MSVRVIAGSIPEVSKKQGCFIKQCQSAVARQPGESYLQEGDSDEREVEGAVHRPGSDLVRHLSGGRVSADGERLDEAPRAVEGRRPPPERDD